MRNFESGFDKKTGKNYPKWRNLGKFSPYPKNLFLGTLPSSFSFFRLPLYVGGRKFWEWRGGLGWWNLKNHKAQWEIFGKTQLERNEKSLCLFFLHNLKNLHTNFSLQFPIFPDFNQHHATGFLFCLCSEIPPPPNFYEFLPPVTPIPPSTWGIGLAGESDPTPPIGVGGGVTPPRRVK